MDSRPALPGRRKLSLVGIVVAIASAFVVLLPTLPAFGHGTAITPPSRHFDCWDRWGDDFQNPDMETEDPMCWQAWQADVNAMWNWNGLYREQVGGDHEGAIPDGSLCSGGHTADGRYDAMDVPGEWVATEVDNNFTFVNVDAASHGADYYRIYVTEQGFDPTTQPLTWGDLELVEETGSYAPGEGEPNPEFGGVNVSIPVSAPGRSGRHIVYMIWQASHFDQSFYSCSDVIFPGG
jgi:lytic cellulose monooxygenase (C4-dehydrogenating)